MAEACGKYGGQARHAATLLKSIVAIPSLSFEEKEVCLFISRHLESCGLGHIVEGNNIIVLNKGYSPEKKTLMLNAHIDTVPPCEGYSFDPYNPDYEAVAKAIPCLGACMAGDFVCGLGSNDDGASVVSLIEVFRHFHDAELPVNLVLVLSCEEERSGSGGMADVWERFPEILKRAFPCDTEAASPKHPDWAIIGEPTGMQAAVSERGLLVIDAVAEGASGHAARNEGVNAIYIAMDDIAALRSHRFGRVSPVMGEVRLNVTQINAGTVHNIIPDRCGFVIDIRPTELYSNAEILDELQGMCRSRLKARNLNNRSSATPLNSLLLRCIENLGIGQFSSPTTSDWMRTGCEAIKMGPGNSSRSHRKDEFVYVSEIDEAIGTYISFIEELCRNIANK